MHGTAILPPVARPPSARRDALMWLVAVAAAAIATAIASAGGARLGAALTAGVIVLVAVVVGAAIMDDRRD